MREAETARGAAGYAEELCAQAAALVRRAATERSAAERRVGEQAAPDAGR